MVREDVIKTGLPVQAGSSKHLLRQGVLRNGPQRKTRGEQQ